MYIYRRIPLFILALIATLASPAYATNWAVYYSDQEPAVSFMNFDVVVFDNEAHPPVRPLIDRGKTLLGYVNLGEIRTERTSYTQVKREDILLGENPNWPGSYYVDIRDSRWAAIILQEIIPQILHSGFNGIFLDTLDSPLYLEETNPEKYRGMKAAAVALVRSIRMNYPGIKIMVNRAYDILPDIVPYVDMVLGESIYTDYDFEKKTYNFVPENQYKKQVNILKKAKEVRPSLQVMTLDYWNPEDEPEIRKIYEVQRANGFTPYVATIALNEVVPAPPREEAKNQNMASGQKE